MRAATILCLVFSAMSGIYGATEAMALLSFDKADLTQHPPSPLLGDPALALRVFKTQAAALESMRVGRSLTLAGLAMACALVSVSAARMLRPRGLPREALRRVLGGSCLAAAMLRSVDGAESAVVMQRVGAELARTLPPIPELNDPATVEQLRQALPSLLVGFTALHTALIAGLFLVCAQYFRSRRAREQLAALEGRTIR
jgi:hypothetical protein